MKFYPASKSSRIGCLEPVRTEQQKQIFVRLGGAKDVPEVGSKLDRLVQSGLGDLFLAKAPDGEIFSWVKVSAGGGGGVIVESGEDGADLGNEIADFAKRKHENKRLLGDTWQDERGECHADEMRIRARLRELAEFGLARRFNPQGVARRTMDRVVLF